MDIETTFFFSKFLQVEYDAVEWMHLPFATYTLHLTQKEPRAGELSSPGAGTRRAFSGYPSDQLGNCYRFPRPAVFNYARRPSSNGGARNDQYDDKICGVVEQRASLSLHTTQSRWRRVGRGEPHVFAPSVATYP